MTKLPVCKLHNYVLLNQTDDGIVDLCLKCRKRLVTHIGKDGKLNNQKYLKEHKRDFLQNYHKEYDKAYRYKKAFISKEESSHGQDD